MSLTTTEPEKSHIPLSALIHVEMLNRTLRHGAVEQRLQGHSGRCYGPHSRYSPSDLCHVVRLTLAEYEAARDDIFKMMTHSSSRVWEPRIVVNEEMAKGERRKAMDYPEKVEEFYQGYQLGLVWGPAPMGASLSMLLGYLVVLEAGRKNDMLFATVKKLLNDSAVVKRPESQKPEPRLGETPVEQGGQTNNQELHRYLPEITAQTPWNEVQKIAREWRVDLKGKKRAQVVKELAEDFAKITSREDKPARKRVVQHGTYESPATLEQSLWVDVVEDEAAFVRSQGKEGVRRYESEPIPPTMKSGDRLTEFAGKFLDSIGAYLPEEKA